jgi:hypothetical protein
MCAELLAAADPTLVAAASTGFGAPAPVGLAPPILTKTAEPVIQPFAVLFNQFLEVGSADVVYFVLTSK